MNLIGNQEIKRKLDNIIQTNKISHSYLFVGTKGIGKIQFARKFAKGILCVHEGTKPCEKCQSCLEFDNHNNPDYFEIGLEEEENSIKIDTIRQMQKKVQELPIVSHRKVYVIDNSDLMTKEAQNCLLKTLEEPPPFVTIILITSDENKILSTIQSRCLKINFHVLSHEELKQYIQSNLKMQDFTESMLVACQGSIGKAEQIYQHKEIYQELDNLFDLIENKTLTEVMSKAEILYKNKEEIQNILEYLNAILISKAKENSKYTQYIQYVEDTKKDLLLNANYDMTIDRLLFRIWEE